MTINKIIDGSKMVLEIGGRLDTTTAPELEAAVKESIDGINSLDINLAELEYVSSAGLRVILSAQKTMNKQGDMVIRNVNDEVMEIFEVTGFVDILTIE